MAWISQQTFRCGLEGKRLQHLLCSPFCRRIGPDIDVNHTPIMPEHGKPIEFQSHSMYCKEVDGSELRPVVEDCHGSSADQVASFPGRRSTSAVRFNTSRRG